MAKKGNESEHGNANGNNGQDEKTTENSRRPKDTAFRQQRIKSWLPILVPQVVIGLFLAIGIIFVPIGNLLLQKSEDLVEYEYQYEGGGAPEDCKVSQGGQAKQCQVTIGINKVMKPPVYVYYKLDKFYQNHRRYVKSRSSAQLMGTQVDTDANCDPLRHDATTGQSLNPCGLIANSFFNDTFTVAQAPASYLGTAASFMSESQISWSTDREVRFGQPDDFKYAAVGTGSCADASSTCETCLGGDQYSNCKNYTDPGTGTEYRFWYPGGGAIKWLYESYPGVISPIEGVENEHFIVWMRTAGLPSFKKLYGRITTTLYPGDAITFNVTANYDVSKFDGKKWLILATVSEFGSKSERLGVAYIALGSLSLAIGLCFLVLHLFRPRKPGDTKFIRWKEA